MDVIADDESWLVLAERTEQVKKMPRELLIAHLSVQGWVPVVGTREALQRGTERVNIIERSRGLSVSYYVHPEVLVREERSWDSIPDARLRMLAERIVRAEFDAEFGHDA